MELPDVSLDSTSPSLFSPASPDVKIRGKATRKFKKERDREAADVLFEEDDDSLSFKHGKDNTFDRLCAGAKGKNKGRRAVGRGRVRSPFSPVDDNPKVFSSSGECGGATAMSFASVSSSDASGGGGGLFATPKEGENSSGGGGLFASPKQREDSSDDDKPLRVKRTVAKTVPKKRANKKQAAPEKNIVPVLSDSMMEFCKRPVRSRETSSASDGNGSVLITGEENGNGARKEEVFGTEVFGTGVQVINVQPRCSLLQLDGSPSASAFMQHLPTSTPIGDREVEAKEKVWNTCTYVSPKNPRPLRCIPCPCPRQFFILNSTSDPRHHVQGPPSPHSRGG